MAAGRSNEARTVTVTTASGSTAVTGAEGTFQEEDAGRAISGTGIPAGAKLASVTSDTAAVLSAAATAAGSVTVKLGPADPSAYGFWGWSPESDAESETYPIAAGAGASAPSVIPDDLTRAKQRTMKEATAVSVDWSEIVNKPTTFPPQIGTSASTAAAGNHTHPGLTADQAVGTASVRTLGTGALQAAAGTHTHAGLTADAVAGTASIRTLGTGAQQAAVGSHSHTATQVTATVVGTGSATNVQGILGELNTRIAALEAG